MSELKHDNAEESAVKIDRPSIRGFFAPWKALLGFFNGFRITWHYFSHPKTVITQQYPENRDELKMAERFRSRLAMVHDEDGFHKCTVCGLCEQACPNGSIKLIERKESATGKTELDAYLWRLDSCTFCNICVMVCPFSVLTMDGKFEGAVYDRRLFIYNLAQYAGATSGALRKVEDPKEREKMTEPRSPYYGPIPVQGHDWSGLEGLRKKDPDEPQVPNHEGKKKWR